MMDWREEDIGIREERTGIREQFQMKRGDYTVKRNLRVFQKLGGLGDQTWQVSPVDLPHHQVEKSSCFASP
jgi:hypothetical protein